MHVELEGDLVFLPQMVSLQILPGLQKVVCTANEVANVIHSKYFWSAAPENETSKCQ